MNFNRLGIISLIAAVVFVLPLCATAQDGGLTSDGKVPGKPFEVLQQQIDDLQQQINAIQDNRVKAYTTGNGDVIIGPNSDANVMTMSLPMGKFINTITLSVGPWPVTGPIPDTPVSFLSCQFVDDENNQVTGNLVGGSVIYAHSFAVTTELQIFDSGINEVTLTCNSQDTNGSISEIKIFAAIWTAIKVDDVDIQPPPGP